MPKPPRPFPKGNKFHEHPKSVAVRFKPGNNKHAIPCIYDLARQKAEAEGYDLHEALWQVVKQLLAQAAAGDVGSAKLILERLSRPAPTELKVEQDGRVQIIVDTGVPKRELVHPVVVLPANTDPATDPAAELFK